MLTADLPPQRLPRITQNITSNTVKARKLSVYMFVVIALSVCMSDRCISSFCIVYIQQACHISEYT